jgi:hypothetical protein
LLANAFKEVFLCHKKSLIGDKVSVRKAKDVPLSFKGTVEKLYANAAMLTIDSFSPDDASLVEDMKNKTVVELQAY